MVGKVNIFNPTVSLALANAIAWPRHGIYSAQPARTASGPIWPAAEKEPLLPLLPFCLGQTQSLA
jgi:hypothetical protein